MKKFLILLLKGTILASAVGASVCFLAWFWGNWRAIAWYAVGLVFIWQMWKYFKTPILEKSISGHYEVVERVSIRRRFNIIARDLLCLAAFFAVLYGAGLLNEWLFDYSNRYFELTMLWGFLLLVSGVVVYLIIGILYCLILDINWKHYFFIWRCHSHIIIPAVLICILVTGFCVVLSLFIANMCYH